MRDGIVQINARPIRHAFLVDPTDVDSLQRVIEINTFLWGGKFNAIIPTFQNSPENWYDCDNINPQDIVSGYLNNFDPDCVVPMGRCSDCTLNLGGREVIDHPSMFFIAAQLQGTAGYGISLFETLSHYLNNNEFEFEIMGTPLEICMPHFFDSSYPLLSSLFGTLPENITEILEQKFRNHLSVESVDISASNYVEYIRNQTDHMHNYLFTDQVRSRLVYLMGINSLGFSRISSGGSVIFFFDAEKPIDIIDYWNLRVTGRTVYAIPKQFAQEESIRRFVLDLIGGNATSASNAEADSTAWIKHIEFHRRVIKSSSVSDEEFLEFFNEFFDSSSYTQFQGDYPTMWGKLSVDDTRSMRSFSAGTAYHDIFDLPSNDGVIVKTLAPHIKTQSSFTHTPRFANEIYVSVYNDKLIATSVLPQGFKDMSLFFESDNNVRASKNNLVRLVHEPEFHYQIWLPPSEVIFESWMKSCGWEIEISNAGHIVTQIIKRLGIRFSQVFAIKGIIDLLGEMSNGKSLLQENLWAKLNTILQERRNDGENLEYDAANILKKLVDANVLQSGMKMVCPNCRQNSWFSIDDAGYMLKCPQCFGPFEFPFNPNKNSKWAYRTIGAYDSPNKSEGTYTVLLLLRFFSDRQMLGGAITPLMSFTLKKQNVTDQDEEKIVGKEFDLALFFQIHGRDNIVHRRNNIEVIFAECKTCGEFTEKDIEKMAVLGKKFPDAVLTFAKLSNLTTGEKYDLSELVHRSDNPILILTGEDLLKQSLDEEHYLKGYADFYELCRRTWYKHLEVE